MNETDLQLNWNSLLTIAEQAGLHNMLPMLNSLAPDTTLEERHGIYLTCLGFVKAPAGKGNHHAYLGGLVQHLLEMCSTWEILRPAAETGIVTHERVIKGIILHDLHKAWATFVEDPQSETGLSYAKSLRNTLMTNTGKTLYLINHYHVPMDEYDMNIVECTEGGYNPNPPKSVSSVAKLVYLLDDYSANVLSRADSKTQSDIKLTGNLPIGVKTWNNH